MQVLTGFRILPGIYKYKNTWWYLAIFVFVVHIFSVTSILFAIAKEEDDAPVILQNTSNPAPTPMPAKTSTPVSSYSSGPILSTDKDFYIKDESILISIHTPANTPTLSLYDPSGVVYRFLEEQSLNGSYNYIYTADSEGNYTLIANFVSGNETMELRTDFTVTETGSSHRALSRVSPEIDAMIPEDAMNVEFFIELEEEKPPASQHGPPDKANGRSIELRQETAVINQPVKWVLSNGSNIVKYRTPPVRLVEENSNDTIKRVIVESTASIHYYNITSFTNITETRKEYIRLFWFDNGTRVDVTPDPAYNLTFFDTDGNGLINRVQWTVPKLSSQTFEIETITIINVQSYPTLGGNWTVRFNTSGTSNLSITPVNGTLFGNDLEFSGLWCGTTELNAIYNGTSVTYPGWNCPDEGRIVNRPITSGKHTLEFVFGNSVEHAYNLVDSNLNLTPENITFVYSAGQRPDVIEIGEAKEGINLTVNATIYNQGVSESGQFSVLFYDGGIEFYNTSIENILAGGSANATAYWKTLAGTHNITVRADPSNITQDSDPGNNNASKNINISAWQKYYGNVSGNIALATSETINLTKWGWSNTSSGYIYLVKKGATINWSSLWALGYIKDSTTKGTADFLDADTALGMKPGVNNATDFTGNNISSLFSSDGTSAISTLNVTVRGKIIENVAVTNSTNLTNITNVGGADYITGLLWDTGDAAGAEYTGAEDLVFIAKINHSSKGLVNIYHDYEIAIPNAMRATVSGDVDFYKELR
ncbi:MAG: hypothetical protein FIB08_08355 [Candidatus Methanoperedens sp.]|nr:hypothetical protein [Candidatus Methanoperedens sp.]